MYHAEIFLFLFMHCRLTKHTLFQYQAHFWLSYKGGGLSTTDNIM